MYEILPNIWVRLCFKHEYCNWRDNTAKMQMQTLTAVAGFYKCADSKSTRRAQDNQQPLCTCIQTTVFMPACRLSFMILFLN